MVCFDGCQEFACNGTVVEHPEYGEVIQLQGDQRQNISKFIKQVGLAREDQIKVCTLDFLCEYLVKDLDQQVVTGNISLLCMK